MAFVPFKTTVVGTSSGASRAVISSLGHSTLRVLASPGAGAVVVGADVLVDVSGNCSADSVVPVLSTSPVEPVPPAHPVNINIVGRIRSARRPLRKLGRR